MVSPRKLARLAALGRIADIAVCVDAADGVRCLEAAAEDAGVRLGALVEIDVGSGRCGVAPGPDGRRFGAPIAASRICALLDLQAYHGAAQHERNPERRQASIASAVDLTAAVVEDLKRIGLACAIVGGAGTGSFQFEAASGVYTELQVGSYVFMDADYARNQSPPPFQQALFVLSSVMSAPRVDMAVVDAGHKAVAIDSGLPLVVGRPGVTYIGASDEHGKLTLAPDASPIKLGGKVWLAPGHCDPTVDRHDWYVVVRGGRVACLWPVAARGAMT